MPRAKSKVVILVVAPCAFPWDRGTPIRIQRLATLMSREYDIHVATFHQGRIGDFPFKIHRIPRLPFDLTQSSGASLGKLICDVFLLALVIWLVARRQVQLVDGHLHEGAFIGLVARALFGVPVIYNSHGTMAAEMIAAGIVKENSRLARWIQFFEDSIERQVNLVIAQSTMRRDDYFRKGISPERIVLVEDAPLFENYQTVSIDPQLVKRFRPNGETVLIYAGELMQYQGVDLILDALPSVLVKHPQTKLIFFGRPIAPYRARVETEHLASNVFLVDDEPYERLPNYLALSDIALVPRLYGCNVPGKLPIYMASGRAIIGTDNEGINTVLRHGETGWLIKPEANALAEAISHLIEHPDLCAYLGSAAKQEASRRYAPEKVEHEMHLAYKLLLTGSADG